MLACERAIDSVMNVKRNEALGQGSLFGADTQSVATFEVPVPAGEWEKSTLLAFEREMLGLYVSDHPLLGREAALAQLAECSVAQLLAAGDGRVATVAGILSGVRRKITRQGAAWAAATLEDLGGAVEVLFFPATYQRCATLLADDALVVVRGRLDRGDEAPQLVAMEVTAAPIACPRPARPRGQPPRVPPRTGAGHRPGLLPRAPSARSPAGSSQPAPAAPGAGRNWPSRP